MMEWMINTQLGRRNLPPAQRLAVAEKYRPIYERQALLNKQIAMQEARKNNDKNKSEQISVNLPKTAGVSTDTYSKGKKILDSDDDDLKILLNLIFANVFLGTLIL